MSTQPKYSHLQVLWLEEQVDEYYPIDEDLSALFTLDEAEFVEDAIRYLKERRYDLVILDLMLPQNREEHKLYQVHLEAGQHVLRKLRDPDKSENWATPFDCQVIVFTARGDKEALEEVHELIGQNGELIQKPVDPDAFIQTVLSILLSNED
jgi:CheY-like chemotaxis protein